MIVHSPIHSFVDFEERLEAWKLPVVDVYRPSFQCLFESGSVGWDDVILIQLVSPDKNTVLADLDQAVGIITNACSWCTIAGIPVNNNAYPLVVQPNNVIPAATYASYQALLDAFKLQGLNAKAGIFLHCCDHGDTNHYDIETSGSMITVDFTRGLQYITFAIDVENPDVFDAIAVGSCFRYCIYNQTQDAAVFSNVFVRRPDQRHLMVVEYSSNEDSYDFKYPGGIQNVVYLPMKVRNPQYPEKRKVYKKSNEHYKVLSASIEKEYELITDYLPDEIHERITVMLAHDNMLFGADNISSTVSKREGDDYSVDWPADMMWHDSIPIAQGKGKISVPFEGRNSNCEQRPICTFTPIDLPACMPVSIAGTIYLPDAVQNAAYNASIQLTGTAPFTLSDIVKPAWMSMVIFGDNVILSGTPLATASNIAISCTIHNCDSNTVNYSDTINIGAANGTHWANDTEVTEDDPTLQSWHNVEIAGQPGETVVVKVTNYANAFGGSITFNGSGVTAIGNTFSFTLNGSGNSGSIPVRLQGVSGIGHPYGMNAAFTIISATGGNIGSPNIFQISKAFS